jgi:hypothetical protein
VSVVLCGDGTDLAEGMTRFMDGTRGERLGEACSPALRAELYFSYESTYEGKYVCFLLTAPEV